MLSTASRRNSIEETDVGHIEVGNDIDIRIAEHLHYTVTFRLFLEMYSWTSFLPSVLTIISYTPLVSGLDEPNRTFARVATPHIYFDVCGILGGGYTGRRTFCQTLKQRYSAGDLFKSGGAAVANKSRPLTFTQ